MQKPALLPLTSLRFFAAMMVVFFHHPAIFYNLFVEKLHFYSGFLFIHHGYATVAFFFVLSGFILSYNYYGRDFSGKMSRLRFYIARTARIYPAYFFALLMAVPPAIYYLLKVPPTGPEIQKAFVIFPLSLVMLQSWVPLWLDNFSNINGPGWSLSVELILYISFPFLLAQFSRFKPPVLFFLALVLVFLGILPVIIFEYQHFNRTIFMSSVETLEIPGGGTSWQGLANTLPLIHIPQFAIGVIAGILFIQYSDFLKRFSGYLVWPVVVFILWIFSSDHFSSRSLQTGILAIPYALLIVFAAADQRVFKKILSMPLLVRLGEISYGIYIFAFPFESCYKWILDHVLHVELTLAYFFMYCILLILFCNWFHRYEDLMRKKIVSFFDSRFKIISRSAL